MTSIDTVSRMAAFNASMRRINYYCVEESMDVLAADTGLFITRAHMPMIDGSIGIDYSRTDPDIDHDQTASIEYALIPGLARIALSDIRRDSDGKKLQSKSIKFCGRTAVVRDIEIPLEGLVLDIHEDGLHTVMGIIGRAEVPLSGITPDHADLLALPLLGILKARAKSTSSHCPELM
jgi:hypothetical protein